ncbi:MAG TPA: nickel pincer cofactor biosynthesis protein LarC, partial [Armatimonadota bacterium]|nr:nickel pincer cofactor biosynthesis protein LarC [Armatimonadota bacterium]
MPCPYVQVSVARHPNTAAMKIAHLDCFSGVSGNMLLGALVDCGLDAADLQSALAGLALEGWALKAGRVRRGPIDCTLVEVEVTAPQPERRLADILGLIQGAGLDPAVAQRSADVFCRLAEAEAAVHGVAVEQVHFHEVGAVDAIVDIVGAVAGFRLLGIERATCSPLPLGGGWVETAHGKLPLPAPATAKLLEGCPTYGGDAQAELVTPTGAALVTGLCAAFGPPPPMMISRAGYGAGSKDLPHPNCLRIFLGEPAEGAPPTPGGEPLVLLETNLDDMNPELYEHVMERLFAAGALDVFITPIIMKKTRPGSLLTALAPPEEQSQLLRILFRETTTLGVRAREVTRYCLEREWIAVETPYGEVRVKVARMGGEMLTASPEHEDCKRLARATGAPLK